MEYAKTVAIAKKTEAHGTGDDIDGHDLIGKGARALERAKNKVKSKIHHKEAHGRVVDIDESTPIDAVKGPNVLERAREEVDAIKHKVKAKIHKKETHGTSGDIDENTPIEMVKGPSLLDRAKEEIEALVEASRPKKPADEPREKNEMGFWEILGKRHIEPRGMGNDISDHTLTGKGARALERAKDKIKSKIHYKESHGRSSKKDKNTPINEVNGLNVLDRAREEVEAIKHEVKAKIHKTETHGTIDDIDENTPVEMVDGPSLLDRAKEEIGDLLEASRPKKLVYEPCEKNELRFWENLGIRLAEFCAPSSRKKD